MSQVKTPLALNRPFTLQPEFIAASCNVLVKQCHEANVAAGWWSIIQQVSGVGYHSDAGSGAPTGITNVEAKITGKSSRNVGEMLMLCVSELAEAMEGDRKDLNDDKLPQYKMIGVELADCMIRICDLAGALEVPLGEIMAAKMAYNAQRADHKPENRSAVGGKKY